MTELQQSQVKTQSVMAPSVYPPAYPYQVPPEYPQPVQDLYNPIEIQPSYLNNSQLANQIPFSPSSPNQNVQIYIGPPTYSSNPNAGPAANHIDVYNVTFYREPVSIHCQFCHQISNTTTHLTYGTCMFVGITTLVSLMPILFWIPLVIPKCYNVQHRCGKCSMILGIYKPL